MSEITMKDRLIKIWNLVKTKTISASKETAAFITSRGFLKNLGMMIGLGLALLFMTFKGLKCYTNHGESVGVPLFKDLDIADAQNLADENGFVLSVIDSIDNPNLPGGVVTNQFPLPKAEVKEGRTIYLTLNSYQREQFDLADLALYGKRFENKRRDLESSRYQINCVEKSRKADKSSPGTILEVYMNDELVLSRVENGKGIKVPKGATLEFVLSGRATSVQVPNLVCQTFEEAQFVINNANLTLNNANEDNSVTNKNRAYVYKQEPSATGGKRLPLGGKVTLYLTQARPEDCQ